MCRGIGLWLGATTSGSRCGRAGRFVAARKACPDWRRSAPSDAPERSSAPTTTAVAPTIAAPVEPSSVPTIPSSAWPASPPCSAPSASSRPSESTVSPVRNGRTSTSSLRATMSRPIAINAAGATYAAAPIAPSSPSTIHPPTTPPSQPNQKSVARKSPAAVSPSPHSSGWWWPRCRRPRRFFTRAGTRGRSGLLRFLRAMGADSTPGSTPLRASRERPRARTAIHRRACAPGSPRAPRGRARCRARG